MAINPFEELTVSKLGSLTTVKRTKGETLFVNHRFAYAVSFCLSGRLTYTHNGKKFVSDPDHAILLPKGQNYMLHCNESGEFPVINFYATDSFCPTEFYTVKLGNLTPYINDYNTLQHLDLLKKSTCRIKSLAVFYSILSRLASETKPYEHNRTLALAVEHIENNISDPQLDIAVLADITHISEVFLRRLFKNELGISPKQYIIQLRLSKAKQLLISSGLPISQVAEDCGYSSIYHFSRAFKASTGYTPSEYRSQQSQLML